MDQNYTTNLLRLVAAQLFFQNTMTTSREMFGKPYFSLGLAEKIAVDQAVLGHLDIHYKQLTEEFFLRAPTNPVGFGTDHLKPGTDSTKTG